MYGSGGNFLHIDGVNIVGSFCSTSPRFMSIVGKCSQAKCFLHKYHPGSGPFVNRLWLYASGIPCRKLHFDFLRKPIPDSQFPSGIDPQDFFPRFAVADGRRAEVVKSVLPLFAGIMTFTVALVMARHAHIGVISLIFHIL
jgi:hypothetical protein